MVKSWAQTLCLVNDPAQIEGHFFISSGRHGCYVSTHIVLPRIEHHLTHIEYKRLHANSWPEILDALKQVGILSMKIYLKVKT